MSEVYHFLIVYAQNACCLHDYRIMITPRTSSVCWYVGNERRKYSAIAVIADIVVISMNILLISYIRLEHNRKS